MNQKRIASVEDLMRVYLPKRYAEEQKRKESPSDAGKRIADEALRAGR